MWSGRRNEKQIQTIACAQSAICRVAMSYFPVILCVAFGFVLCWSAIPVIRRFAFGSASGERNGEFHHARQTPVPRLGGLALVLTFVLLAAALSLLIPPI